MSAGADDLCVKPYQPGELILRVRAGERLLSLETRDLLIFALAKLAESRDTDTGAHLERVRTYSRVIAEERAMPDLILIDGGRGQLNAARAALEKLDKGNVPIAGLAKREEEIYLPDVEEPLRLEKRDPALQLLQQVRDETHRFAITSHRKKRSRRTLTSELDRLEGVGEKRKRTLLEHFGSVSAVRQASVQDLSNVLGPRVGRAVWEQLNDGGR